MNNKLFLAVIIVFTIPLNVIAQEMRDPFIPLPLDETHQKLASPSPTPSHQPVENPFIEKIFKLTSISATDALEQLKHPENALLSSQATAISHFATNSLVIKRQKPAYN